MCKVWTWYLILTAELCRSPLMVLAVVGGGPAAPPEPDAAVVFVQKHGRSARLEGYKDNNLNYYSFSGIRYAEPPVGVRRFQRPVRRLLAGEFSAVRNCFPCPQLDPRDSRRIIGNEDCLCLNVFAPKMPGEETGSPVIFFIHGGNYRSGSITPYGGQHFTQEDTILVTAQYRLGSLGFLSTGQRDASGNAGLFDLHAAMTWVADYIEFFGGDPKKVVVMGQGSGGSAASLLGLSSEGRSAKGVVALSGAPLSPGAVRTDPAKHAQDLANNTDCPTTPAERLLICLRKLPPERIVLADRNLAPGLDTKAFLDEISGRTGSGARVEGEDDKRALPPLVVDTPADSITNNKRLSPLLTGVTSAETSRAVFGQKYSQFLTSQLAAIKDFIKRDVVGGLKNVIQSVPNLIPIIPQVQVPLADFYQAVFDNTLNVMDGLTKVAEATGDAVFNFPAYQTVKSWGNSGDAYLYSFEHVGNLSKGAHFLPGLVLTDTTIENTQFKERANEGPAHGDDLAYLFEPLDDEGKSIGETVSQMDARVRKSFVKLISKFAHSLSPVEEKNTTNLLGFIPFSNDNDQFLKITSEEIKIDKNFRYCQMGLWGNMADRLGAVVCKNLFSKLLNLPKLPFSVQTPHILPVLQPGSNQPMKLPNLLPLQPNQNANNDPSKLPNLLPGRQNLPLLNNNNNNNKQMPDVLGLGSSQSNKPRNPLSLFGHR